MYLLIFRYFILNRDNEIFVIILVQWKKLIFNSYQNADFKVEKMYGNKKLHTMSVPIKMPTRCIPRHKLNIL